MNVVEGRPASVQMSRYRKHCGGGGGWMAILVVVCGKMCGKIEKLSDWNKNSCGTKKKYSARGRGGSGRGGGLGGGPL